MYVGGGTCSGVDNSSDSWTMIGNSFTPVVPRLIRFSQVDTRGGRLFHISARCLLVRHIDLPVEDALPRAQVMVIWRGEYIKEDHGSLHSCEFVESPQAWS